MFTINDDEAAAIRTAFTRGEWAAVDELRRYFPIRDDASALNAVRMIMRWYSPHETMEASPPAPVSTVAPRRKRSDRGRSQRAE